MPSSGGKTALRLLVAAGIVVAVLLFHQLGLGRYLDLAYLKESRQHLTGLYHGNRPLFIAAYMLAYVTVAALSLPGAAILTLAGGAVMGFWAGLVTVSFASSIGATMACAVSRFLLRDWVSKRFGTRLAPIYRGVEREGPFYLFSLRLVPAFPFFLVNIAMGLTPMPLATFYWISQIGMLPGTAVYVNAGRELGRIDSLSAILSPGLLVSFALLGLFPLVARKALAMSGRRRTDGTGA